MTPERLAILKQCMEDTIKNYDPNREVSPEEQQWRDIFNELEQFGEYLSKHMPHVFIDPKYLVKLIY